MDQSKIVSLVKDVGSGLALTGMIFVVRGNLFALARWRVASADVRTSPGGKFQGWKVLASK